MTSTSTQSWSAANQRYLMANVEALRHELELYQIATNTDSKQYIQKQNLLMAAQQAVEEARADLSGPAALDTMTSLLGLSDFERKVLLMGAAVELEADFSALIATLQNGLVLPTFSLALAALADPHWNALSPNAPLRYWRLLDVTNSQLLTKSPLKIDEQVLYYLTGLRQLDDRLQEIAEPVLTQDVLVPSQRVVVKAMVETCINNYADTGLPVIQLRGDSSSDKTTIAAVACVQLGLQLYSISVNIIPVNTKEITELTRLWNREAALNSYALYVDTTELDTTDKARLQAVTSFVQGIQGLLFVDGSQTKPSVKRKKVIVDVRKPMPAEQLALWKDTLGAAGSTLNGQLEQVVSQFNLSSKTIQAVCEEIQHQAVSHPKKNESAELLGQTLWRTCCAHTRPQLTDLGEYIEPVSGWNDLVLPEAQQSILREISVQVKQRAKVYNEWGFSSKGTRGMGISALFAGESGTGKTMASEVLANELQLDLYRIDLSQVVNKYIGETEKNLKRIFDAAEEGGAILLFDEADALFGKRSDVKDSHDRYSNIEVSYLLQRMEAYRGLAILTTNMKSALDKAFLRRIRFVVQFPYPDALLRREIWKRVFPKNTPTENLNIEKLSRLNVPGGNIRNIALNAAFLAAHENQPVQMPHIAMAARSEYSKLERPLSTNEIGKW